ncbi:hypothetical protein K2X30_00140 [bacterium]|nr:hypothetical protein [bacterium]
MKIFSLPCLVFALAIGNAQASEPLSFEAATCYSLDPTNLTPKIQIFWSTAVSVALSPGMSPTSVVSGPGALLFSNATVGGMQPPAVWVPGTIDITAGKITFTTDQLEGKHAVIQLPFQMKGTLTLHSFVYQCLDTNQPNRNRLTP